MMIMLMMVLTMMMVMVVVMMMLMLLLMMMLMLVMMAVVLKMMMARIRVDSSSWSPKTATMKQGSYNGLLHCTSKQVMGDTLIQSGR
eukprot:86558-Pyramimonas_sp.AAC.1